MDIKVYAEPHKNRLFGHVTRIDWYRDALGQIVYPTMPDNVLFALRKIDPGADHMANLSTVLRFDGVDPSRIEELCKLSTTPVEKCPHCCGYDPDKNCSFCHGSGKKF